MLSTRFLVPAIFLALFQFASPLSSTSLSKRALSGHVIRNPTLRKTRTRRSSVNLRRSSTGSKDPFKTEAQKGTLSKNDISSDTNLNSMFGGLDSNGCKGKKMSYLEGKNSFDQDKLTEHLILYNNAWGAGTASYDSSQITECHSYDSQYAAVSWTTSYTWKSTSKANQNQVKSYSNVAWAPGYCMEISALTEFKTVWEWEYLDASPDLAADVSFDMFTSKNSACSGQSGGCASHEVMLWLSARGGALPAGTKVNPKPFVIENRYSFDVYQGQVNGIPVLSLIPTPGNEYTHFHADLIPAMRNLTAYGLESDEYICTLGTGTEPFEGQATLFTSVYSLRISENQPGSS
ncbi:hypothetical protein CROQUDRAFT_589726 [Cronartium quercuum f. sp. fusiforme G11]|uniref:Uncharacterized protein n=1 Tax=Cronartium quercuum f. sp. fusiforme G11 TaxID=708437 RepID=A0A9P6NFG5_9BASI|nr:hypothetical protein CROQUDRAFT_589726 [Cronartium quercuum f. sp. fusiforme G11]